MQNSNQKLLSRRFNLRKLVNDLKDRFWAVFSPNGQTIAFETSKANRADFDIYLFDINTNQETLLIDKDPFMYMGKYPVYLDQTDPSWSPDGKKIAFIDKDFKSSMSDEVFVFELNSKKITQITNTPDVPLSLPAWSPAVAMAAAPGLHWQEDNFLLQSYPNPANPETWIPFQLKQDSEITLLIHDIKGILIREINLGLKPAGSYTSKSKAVYWDGRNDFGERVASGVYFYTLTANNFTATRKMLILK